MDTKKVWTKILGYRIGDIVRITQNFQTLPKGEKGKLGKIIARSGGRGDVYLIDIQGWHIWLNESYFEKVEKDV